MGDYNLHGLNPRDFQHLVQAIARKTIASGVTAFGDGKDGARDLTYHGKMDYPSRSAPWNGYLVLSCKFLQQPITKSTEWSVQQLEKDLKKFLDEKRNLPKPEYYLFVTNVGLTGAAVRGGRDRVNSVLFNYASKLGLKGYGVWDYNDLRGFLDGDGDLCSHYGHFISTGDVLSEVIKLVKPRRSDFLDVMQLFLQKELTTDMSAKLQDAGEDPEVQIPLANVFVDLPFANSIEAATLTRGDNEPKAGKIVASLLEAASSVFRRKAEEPLIREQDRARVFEPSRFVIVGGPGQGKSTLGQYLCQLFRASLLQDRPEERLEERVVSIIKQLAKQAEESGRLPLARRFPIRIELKTFSQALANEPDLTLLEYLRRDIGRLGNTSVILDDLSRWLERYPWLMVLDGLDEVPPSSNRGEVITQIEHFQIDAASRNADLMLVLTTRPQSYSKEFSDDLFRHIYLVPLSPKEALNYGRKLAEARCRGDDRRKDELIRSLEKACENEQTARLMQSPLQVTIMATLLEETGEPPQQRYRLFADYYRTIYKRETRRKLLLGILTERQTDIDTIHHHAGLHLHARGEGGNKHAGRKGNESESALSDEQFKELVRQRLEHLKTPPAQASELLRRITDGSLQRLVFLVRAEDNPSVRFDITSLQEFMAAEALMTGPDEEVKNRLETIAPASFWRNVFLFAVGKCFVDREYLLDNIVSICERLNEDVSATNILGDARAGRAAKATMWGSRLALDILSDGTARQYPEYEIRLVRIALQLVKTGDPEICARLAFVYNADLREMYHDVIEDGFGRGNVWRQVGAWSLVMNLADRGIDWAYEYLKKAWPEGVEYQSVLLFSGKPAAPKDWWLKKALEFAPRSEPWLVVRNFSDRRLENKYIPDPWSKIVQFAMSGPQKLEITNRATLLSTTNRLRLVPTELGRECWNVLKSIKFENPGWFPILAGARFGANPSAKTLASELKRLAKFWIPGHRAFGHNVLPWPLAACLFAAESGDYLNHMADMAATGKFGDVKQWKEAESRWTQVALTDEDVFAMSDDRWPIDSRLSQTGFPFGAVYYVTPDSSIGDDFSQKVKKLSDLPQGRMRSWIAKNLLDTLLFSGRFYPGRISHSSTWQQLSAKDFRELFSSAKLMHARHWINLDEILENTAASNLDPEWVELLNWLGQQDYLFHIEDSNQVVEELIHRFCADPSSKRGLLPIITAASMSGIKCIVSRNSLEVAKHWGGDAKEQATALMLAREDVTEQELKILAGDIVKESESVASAVWRALAIASNASPMREAGIALELLERISPDDEARVDAVGAARNHLVNYLTKLPSNLDKPGVWERLKLPERI